jgi:hypothetical protein
MGIFDRKPNIEKPREEIDVDGLIKVLRDIDKVWLKSMEYLAGND